MLADINFGTFVLAFKYTLHNTGYISVIIMDLYDVVTCRPTDIQIYSAMSVAGKSIRLIDPKPPN